MAKKFMSLADAESKRAKAIELMERTGGDADKFRSMDASEYAASRGAELLPNPTHIRRSKKVTKAELAETVDELADGLEEALDPQLTREELVAKVKDLYDRVSGDEDEFEDEGEDDEEG